MSRKPCAENRESYAVGRKPWPIVARPLLPRGPMEPARHLALGDSGEDLACAALERRGYAIVERRYRTRAGEIDVVARDGAVLVFVEVKTRRSARFGHPAEAVTPAKRRRLARMAGDYLARRRPPLSLCRFDVVAVTIGANGPPEVQVIPGAFVVGE